MPDLIRIVIQKLGVPTDNRFGEEVRERARTLAKKRPDFYQFEGYVLWVGTTNQELFDNVYNWVLYNQGSEPA